MIKGALALTVVFGATLPLSAAVPAKGEEPSAEFNIVNGQAHASTEFSEAVQVQVPLGGDSFARCGGTILADDWVMTAAHCMEQRNPAESVKVFANTPYGKANDGATYTTSHEGSTVYVHPRYNKKGQRVATSAEKAEFDIALVRLDQPISSGKPIHPDTKREMERSPGVDLYVPVATLADTGEGLPRSGNGRVVGWGATWFEPIINPQLRTGSYRVDGQDVLRSAEIPFLHCSSSKIICAEAPVELTEEVRRLPEGNRHHRTEHRNPASCVGDSGGPLFYEFPDGRRKQVGLVSNSPFTPEQREFWAGDVCGRVSTYYTSVSYLRPWIEQVMYSDLPEGERARHLHLSVPDGASTGPGSPMTPPGQQPPRQDPPVGNEPPAAVPPVAQPPAGPPPAAGNPQPVPPGQPAPKPQPTGAPTSAPKPPASLVRPGDPALLKSLPTPSKGSVTWALPALSADQGSELAVGVNRLRDAFADAAPASASTPIALLASEVKMADALASGSLQRDAALYLTNPDAIEPFLLNELKVKKVQEVWLLGGAAALSPAIEDTLKAEGFAVRRIAGADRTQTAVEIAKAHTARYPNAANNRFVARAFGDQGDETRSWADSIALGGLAAKTGTPILLTATQRLSDSVKEQLGAGTKTTVVGGNAAVSPLVKDAINAITGSMPARIAGENRADTAGRIAQSFAKAERAIVIDGQGQNAWQLGFSLAGLSNDLNAPILLTSGTTVPPETKKILKDLELQNVICMGEVKVCEAVSEATQQ